MYPNDQFLNLIDLFYISDFRKVCNSADDRMFHACDNDLKNLIKMLEHDTFLAIEWFPANNMKFNKGKCQLLVAGHKYENVSDKIRMKKFRKVKKWEENYKSDPDSKKSLKLSKCTSFKQNRIFMKIFVESQFEVI